MNPIQLESLIAQTFLRSKGFYQGELDAKWGPLSKSAAARWYRSVNPAGRFQSEEYLRALAAQNQLFLDGFYQSIIDGDFGTISRAAAEEWAAKHTPDAVPIFPPDERRWTLPYDVAKGYIGTKEIPGKNHNPVVVRWLRKLASWINDDETAWCSAFVNFCADEAGYESTGKLNARSWLDIGQHLELAEARKGDVITLWRGSPDGWQGHVAFLDHHNPTRGLVYLLGGNQNNEVNITAYPQGRVIGVRRLRSLDRLQGSARNV